MTTRPSLPLPVQVPFHPRGLVQDTLVVLVVLHRLNLPYLLLCPPLRSLLAVIKATEFPSHQHHLLRSLTQHPRVPVGSLGISA